MNDPIPNLFCVSSEFDEFQFYIGSLKSIQNSDSTTNSIYNIHRFEYYTMMLITEGTGWHYIDYKKYFLKKGSYMLISKNQIQKDEENSDLEGIVVLFTDNFLQKNFNHAHLKSHINIFNYHLYTPLLELKESNYKDLLEFIERINFEYEMDFDEMKGKILGTLLNTLLFKTERISRHTHTNLEQNKYYNQFKNFGDLLEKELAKEKDAKFYANAMNISYKHLNEICKTISSKTAKEFITDFLVLEIKRYLNGTNMSVKEIAYMLGFDEPTNLHKIFKRETGKTTLEFRQIMY